MRKRIAFTSADANSGEQAEKSKQTRTREIGPMYTKDRATGTGLRCHNIGRNVQCTLYQCGQSKLSISRQRVVMLRNINNSIA